LKIEFLTVLAILLGVLITYFWPVVVQCLRATGLPYCYPPGVANMPSKSKRAVTLRLDRGLVERTQRVAAERGETMTDLVVRAVTREVEQRERERG
jgi:hypothetical protein